MLYRHAYVSEGLHYVCVCVMGSRLRISEGFVFFGTGGARVPRYICWIHGHTEIVGVQLRNYWLC